ncbi:MAG TPA: hypothetical protein VMU69_13680 [Bradyrhizobium sp.]|nr:hypothetical protein [Bradyrhizobium sp.]
MAKSGCGDLRQQRAITLDDEEPRSFITRLFNSAPALLIVIKRLGFLAKLVAERFGDIAA